MGWIILGAVNMFCAGLCAAMVSYKFVDERKLKVFDLFLVIGNLAFAFLVFSQ